MHQSMLAQQRRQIKTIVFKSSKLVNIIAGVLEENQLCHIVYIYLEARGNDSSICSPSPKCIK